MVVKGSKRRWGTSFKKPVSFAGWTAAQKAGDAMVRAAIKSRGGGSRTRTKKRRKRRMAESKRVIDIGFTKGTLYKKGSVKTLKRWYKDAVRARYKYLTSKTFLSGNGLQGVNLLPVTMFARPDIDTINTRMLSSVPAGLGSINSQTGLKKCQMITQLKNQTNDEIEVWLYFITPKMDIPTTGLSPPSAWDSGADDQLGTPGTPFDYPYADPREAELFKTMYHVHRKILYRMKSGSLVTDTFNYSPNKIIDESVIQRYTDILLYKHLSMQVMMVQLGPIGRRIGAGQDPTYGPSRVDVVQSVNYTMMGNTSRATVMTQQRTLDTVVGNVVAMTDADETANNIVVVPG